MKLRATLEGHEVPVLCARFDADGRRLATGSRSGEIRVWSARGGFQRSIEGHERAVHALVHSPAGELISADAGGSVRVWSWPRGRLRLELDAHAGPVYQLGVSADGRELATGGGDGMIHLWSLDDGELVHSFEVGPRGSSFVWAADGEHLVSGRGGDTLCFWSRTSGELAWEQDAGPGTVGALELARGGEWVVSRGWRGPVTVWSAASWDYSAVLPIVERGLGGASLRPGHEQVVCIWERAVGVFDATSGELLDLGEVPSRGVYGLDLAPDGRLAATASADGAARIWDLGG